MIGLYGLYGNNWEEFKSDLCAHLGHYWCKQSMLYAIEPISARSLLHYFQMAIESRFQEYSDGYLAGGRRRKTEEIPLQNI